MEANVPIGLSVLALGGPEVIQPRLYNSKWNCKYTFRCTASKDKHALVTNTEKLILMRMKRKPVRFRASMDSMFF